MRLNPAHRQARRFATLALLLASPLASADINPLAGAVTGDTFLVAAIDLRVIADPEAVDAAVRSMTSPALAAVWGASPVREQYAEMVAGPAARLVEAGATKAFLVCDVQDLRPGFGPFLMIPLSEGVDHRRVIDAIPEGLGVRTRQVTVSSTVERLIAVATPKTQKRYGREAFGGVPRLEFHEGEPLELLSGDAVSAVVSLGPDSRRVIRELWPTLPAPLEGLTGPLLADGPERLEVRVTVGAEPVVTAKLETSSDTARDQFQQITTSALAWGAERVAEQYPAFAGVAQAAAEAIAPQSRAGSLIFRVTAEDASLRRLMTTVAPPVFRDAREAAVRSQKMNAAKQIALAMHNFHDVTKQFPAPAAIVDETGAPLLSWRVALLPFLEEQELYDRFRFEEPWHSEHNLRVAEEMPFVFANPSHPELTERGLTTWQRPVFDGSDLADPNADPVFQKGWNKPYWLAPGETFRDFIDGTSNIVMFAEVAPEHAVLWTRPDDDWRVDLDDPLAKLRTETRKAFVAGWYDGHATADRFDVDAEKLRRALTKNGKEVVRW